jgi:hypothetical protein
LRACSTRIQFKIFAATQRNADRALKSHDYQQPNKTVAPAWRAGRLEQLERLERRPKPPLLRSMAVLRDWSDWGARWFDRNREIFRIIAVTRLAITAPERVQAQAPSPHGLHESKQSHKMVL